MKYFTDGEKLKYIRFELKMSQKEFAERCDCSLSYITKVESGYRKMNYELAKKILRIFNFNILGWI